MHTCSHGPVFLGMEGGKKNKLNRVGVKRKKKKMSQGPAALGMMSEEQGALVGTGLSQAQTPSPPGLATPKDSCPSPWGQGCPPPEPPLGSQILTRSWGGDEGPCRHLVHGFEVGGPGDLTAAGCYPKVWALRWVRSEQGAWWPPHGHLPSNHTQLEPLRGPWHSAEHPHP